MKQLWPSLILLAAVSGCVTAPASDDPFFPLLDPTPPGLEEVYLTAAFRGVLVVDHGCVRLRSPSTGEIRTMLWHQGTGLGQDAQGYFLQNLRTGIEYRFGEEISFGGGVMQDKWVESSYPEVVRRCGPPYASGWLPE